MPSARLGAPCVLCRIRPADAAWRPFCSERCKTLDLANWADQAYSVPGEAIDEISLLDAEPRRTPSGSSF